MPYGAKEKYIYKYVNYSKLLFTVIIINHAATVGKILIRYSMDE